MNNPARAWGLPSGFWSQQLRQWHWISSALCLAIMLLFAATGITLNHPGIFEVEPLSELREVSLPAALAARLSAVEDGSVIPDREAQDIRDAIGVSVAGRPASVEYGEMTIDLARPGVDALLAIDLDGKTAAFEQIDRGPVAVLNDLHMGRDAGFVWGVLIDVAAVTCVIFCLTGFGLLWLQARRRKTTWPLVSLGVVVPAISYLIFVHV